MEHSMKLKAFAVAAAGLLAGVLLTTAAEAYPGWASGSVNMRSGPGTAYPRITTIPAGARVEVYSCGGGWCQVFYAGYNGYAIDALIRTGYVAPPRPPRPYMPPPPPRGPWMGPPPPPPHPWMGPPPPRPWPY
jgi:uncharacterized protein YraI